MLSNHLILCHSLLLWPSIFPSNRVFSSESLLCIRWPMYWSFSFNLSPSDESVQLLSRLRLFATPWTAARQASLSFTVSQSLLEFMSIESVMPYTILSSVIHFSSCLQSFPASGSFQMSQFLTSGGQSIGVSALTVPTLTFKHDYWKNHSLD